MTDERNLSQTQPGRDISAIYRRSSQPNLTTARWFRFAHRGIYAENRRNAGSRTTSCHRLRIIVTDTADDALRRGDASHGER